MNPSRQERRRRAREAAKGGPAVVGGAHRGRWLLLVAIGLAGAVYLTALDGPFVYDDRLTVVQNPSIRQLDDPVALVLADVFRPVVNLTYALNYAASGLDPRGYHLLNLLLHMANVGLLFVFVRRLVGRGEDEGAEAVAFAAAVLYAVHPMMTEAVAYISGRSELVCTLFVLLSLDLFQRALAGGGRLAWIGAFAAFGLGLAAKETAAVVPFALLAADQLGLVGEPGRRRSRLLRLHLPFAGLITLAGLGRVLVYLRVEQGGPMLGLWHNALTEAEVFWRYLGLLVAPVSQSIMHPVATAERAFDPLGLAALAGIGALLAGALAISRRAPVAAFGVLWFVLFFAPSHVIPLQEAMAEHRVYTASAGLFLAAGWLAHGLLRRMGGASTSSGRVLVGAGVVVVLVLMAATVARNRVWSDPVLLWGDAARKAPQTWGAQYAWADALRDAGRCGEAVPAYRRAIELLPGQVPAYLNLGICLAELERFGEAEEVLTEAAALAPDDPKPHTNLGTLAARVGRYDQAARHFERAIAVDPGQVNARLLLAQLVEAAFSDRDRARQLCLEARAIAPGHPGVARCLERTGS